MTLVSVWYATYFFELGSNNGFNTFSASITISPDRPLMYGMWYISITLCTIYSALAVISTQVNEFVLIYGDTDSIFVGFKKPKDDIEDMTLEQLVEYFKVPIKTMKGI
jgi:hypothetical protein